VKRVRALAVMLLLGAALTTLEARRSPKQAMPEPDKPVRLRHLQGAAVDGAGIAVPFAAVELIDPKDHHAIASTFADGNGKFFFEDRKRGTQLELRVSRAGFKSAQYEIVMARFGQARLRVALPQAQ
jgi:hypothetical protein